VLVMGGKEVPKLSQEEKGEGHGFIRYESRKKNGP
jgi:hypothetical protein